MLLSLLNAGQCSRRVYLGVLVALLLFDYAKDPLIKYLTHAQDHANAAIWQDVGKDVKGKVPKSFGGSAPDSSATPADWAKVQESIIVGQAKQTAVVTGYVGSLIVLGLVTLVGMLWMIFARLRDIGWPIWVGFAIITPKLIIRLLGTDLPDIGFYVLEYGFIVALIGLGFVPGGFGTGQPGVPTVPSTPDIVPAAPGARAQRASFGQRAR